MDSMPLGLRSPLSPINEAIHALRRGYEDTTSPLIMIKMIRLRIRPSCFAAGWLCVCDLLGIELDC
jgi:hypothetical protein